MRRSTRNKSNSPPCTQAKRATSSSQGPDMAAISTQNIAMASGGVRDFFLLLCAGVCAVRRDARAEQADDARSCYSRHSFSLRDRSTSFSSVNSRSACPRSSRWCAGREDIVR